MAHSADHSEWCFRNRPAIAETAVGGDLKLVVQGGLVRDAMVRMKLRRPRQAAVIAMRHLEGYTIAECIGRLGISDRTVKRDSARGREWLKKELAA